jgi:hypothetical protein
LRHDDDGARREEEVLERFESSIAAGEENVGVERHKTATRTKHEDTLHDVILFTFLLYLKTSKSVRKWNLKHIIAIDYRLKI